jgi:hypothetical protein
MTNNIKKVVFDISLVKPPQETLRDTLINIRITSSHSDFCFPFKRSKSGFTVTQTGKDKRGWGVGNPLNLIRQV